MTDTDLMKYDIILDSGFAFRPLDAAEQEAITEAGNNELIEREQRKMEEKEERLKESGMYLVLSMLKRIEAKIDKMAEKQ
jgi:hypothetical protein